ncbi:hypothetical protein PV735_31990 [Streptomyces turgidiscabies]|uniref:Uncharacterized protein n=1 Tax=Streptomyces turgidiscabies (strain Car8) TaxID=698760 RepID=L7ESW7_STRT8|nr:MULTISPECIES: hypothetical protein [Streptomyces]ELP61480.1 hypothetical protein STRTUCAR8_03663 [Streptomyces turgidiscabies Car8]MDX3497274.1 hypothetical protein [Streptomyces turgidiscabies]GAQ68629.1 hypothetical protein T45_00341 [Streptomyces turgidiscabies]
MSAHIAARAKRILLAIGWQDLEIPAGTPRIELVDPLPQLSVRRASVHVTGLLLLASMVPVTSGMARASAMYGAPWGRRVFLAFVAAQVAAAVIVFFWLAWRVIARTTLTQVTQRQRLLQRAAAVACGIAAMYTAATPLSVLRADLGMAMFGCVVAWLALEVCRDHGVLIGTGFPATATQRLHDWKIAGNVICACGFGAFSATALTFLVRWTGIDGVPVMNGDQLNALGVGRLTNLAGSGPVADHRLHPGQPRRPRRRGHQLRLRRRHRRRRHPHHLARRTAGGNSRS